MSNTAKGSITAWWILALMSLFLWYRNVQYDRCLAVFILTMGLVQLIEYGVCSGTDPGQAARMMYITLWLQCIVLAIGVFVLTRVPKDVENPSTTDSVVGLLAMWNLCLFAVIFITGIATTLMGGNELSVTTDNGYIEWKNGEGSLLEPWGILYFIGLFFPLLLLFGYYVWADIGLAVLLIYAILSAGYVLVNYPISAFISTWCYFSVGFAFLAWFLGTVTGETREI